MKLYSQRTRSLNQVTATKFKSKTIKHEIIKADMNRGLQGY